jgi:hypothetical protein
MATLTGHLADASGTAIETTIRFTPVWTPGASGSSSVMGQTVEVDTDSNGDFSVTLDAGSYHVDQDGIASYTIAIGAAASYDLKDLLALGGGTTDVETPVISPDGGTFYTSQVVTITCATAGASIYFTLDGSTPTSASTLYTAPFTILATTTVKAIGIMSGYSDSAVASAVFTAIPVVTSTVYYGNSASASLDEAGILALGTVTKTSAAGEYEFPDEAGYSYLATPASWATPTTLKTGTFDVALASESPFDTVFGDLTCDLVDVGGVSYRVFRTYYEMGGAWTLTAT